MLGDLAFGVRISDLSFRFLSKSVVFAPRVWDFASVLGVVLQKMLISKRNAKVSG